MLRAQLAEPKKAVRLVGLSGVGKTRFVEAMFDSSVGENALDRTLAIYANMSDSPDPPPVGLVSDLIANRYRSIIVVDNCAADTHRRLAEIVKSPASQASLITIEYDIRDDQPEGTDVFELETASPELIEKLLLERFDSLSQPDANTAASLSDSNARIAIALAGTVATSGSLSGLKDDQIFQRLFSQRHAHDASLLKIAQACSLVYSYNGDDLSEGPEGELTRLGAMVGAAATEVYRATATLLERDLAQRRGVWRAILPHALANRLASAALKEIHRSVIEKELLGSGSQRLITSFARRLGYLHDSPEAVAIVDGWLKPGGWLGDVWNLNSFGRTVFENVLPVSPQAGLAAIEAGAHHLQSENLPSGRWGMVRLLRLLAFDALSFERCAAVLRQIALCGVEQQSKEAADAHAALFPIYLSGTWAPVDNRVKVARELLSSEHSKENQLGLDALRSLLKGGHFHSSTDFKFGTRSRDYGYQPRTYNDICHWYCLVFALAREFEKGSLKAEIRLALADSFHDLWTRNWMRPQLEALFRDIGGSQFWREGWIAAKFTRRFGVTDEAEESAKRLDALIDDLKPSGLLADARPARRPRRECLADSCSCGCIHQCRSPDWIRRT